MKRDTLRTIAGLIIIGLIVVATFLYGNAQRQSQLRRDQAAKKTQQQQNSAAPKVQPSTQAAKPQAQPKTTPTPAPTPITTVPDTGGSNQTMPATGASEDALIPVTLLAFALYLFRRSRRALAMAVRKH